MITIPKRWDQWCKTLVGGMISGGATTALASLSLSAEHSVGLAQQTGSFSNGQIEHQFIAGAVIGALMFLAKSPVPPDSTGDTVPPFKPENAP